MTKTMTRTAARMASMNGERERILRANVVYVIHRRSLPSMTPQSNIQPGQYLARAVTIVLPCCIVISILCEYRICILYSGEVASEVS